ncbi:MAG TPA: purine-nucleoside phosphorylase, partial [Burkholderiales bacterium]|nr:purine-nucleoside phosphorylase [Burkholderiales bacterium]
MRSESQQAAAAIRARAGDVRVDLGLVAGAGLAGIAEHIASPLRFPYASLPGFPRLEQAGGEAELLLGALGTARV